MAQDGRGQPVVVNVGPCRCPGTPHTIGDTVTLRGEPTTPMGVAAWAVISVGGAVWDLQARLADVWRHYGIADWSFTDEKGAAIPITPTAMDDLLPFGSGGREVQDRADELYSEAILRPLVERQSKSSLPTPTEPLTSASPPSGATPPTPFSPSPQTEPDGKPSEVPVP